jgi:putative serine protease PepD
MDDLESQNPSAGITPDTGLTAPLETQETTPPAPPSPPQRKPHGAARYWRWWVASLALGLAVIAGAVIANNHSSTPSAVAAPTTTSATATGAVSQSAGTSTATNTLQTSATPLLDARAVGEKVIPSVVTVEIQGTALNGQAVPVGSGSGVIYDNQGHIITNNHVAAAGSSYEVVLADGRVYPADVIGTDPTTDLAVLQVTAKNLHPISIGSSDALSVGDPAVAVGSPLGLAGGPSLTVGVISAFDRQVQTDSSSPGSAGLDGMLQTDAPIISGSSGGALVNENGDLVGITTAVGVSPVGAEGVGFATPVEIVTRVANEIIANGQASNPYLGVQISTAMADTTDGGTAPIGVKIESVVSGSAADQAGLQAGDVVSAVNGTQMRSHIQLIGYLRRYSAGDTLSMTLTSGRTLNVTLGQRPANQ